MAEDKTKVGDESGAFVIGVVDAFGAGFRGYAKNFAPLTAAAALTLAVYGLFRFPAQQLLNDGNLRDSTIVDLVGLLVSGTLAYPWFSYALDAARGEKVDIKRPFENRKRFAYQAVGSFWFWAGALLGVRFFFGLPSILVLFCLLYTSDAADE